jgi:aldehyde dehydrogenase (NAD+)
MNIQEIISKLGIKEQNSGTSTGCIELTSDGNFISSTSPVDGKKIATIEQTSEASYHQAIDKAQEALIYWKKLPAPQRGEIVRQFGDELRKNKSDLGALVSYEMGKSYQEGLGEVQEMIDICDFAVGLSRQLY